jgi:prophage DNA circulation protein
MAWIDDLDDASFRGVAFQVEKLTLRGGRRLANHQYPKRDKPKSEDLGSKQRQYTFTAYVIGTDGVFDMRDQLIAALDAGGSGLLIHPTYGQLQVMPDDWTLSEDLVKEQNICRFQLTFLDSGDDVVTTPTTDTAQVSASAAGDATSANGASFTSAVAGTWA